MAELLIGSKSQGLRPGGAPKAGPALPAAPSGRGLAIGIAIALHAAALLLFLGLSPERQRSPPERNLTLINLDLAPPPPSQTPPEPRSAPRASPSEKPLVAPPTPMAMKQPTPTPASAPPTPTSASTQAPASPSSGSSGAQQEPDYLPQYKITDVPVIPNAELLSRIVYPPLAARMGIEAIVYVDLYIDQYGAIRKVDVLKDPGYGFAEAAVKALEGVVVAPAKADGRAVAVRFRYQIRFTLK